MSEEQTISEPIKGEVKTYRKNQFNTTEGGTYYGHSNANNAKMAVMLRRIFPSPFKRAQYIGLQQGGELDGSIICSAPKTFQIACGESPAQDVAGVWYAENGDIVIGAPKGRIRIFAQSIDLIATGDGKETGWVNAVANTEFKVDAGNIKMSSDDSFSTESETMDINTTGKTQIDCGSYKINDNSLAFFVPGQGNITIEDYTESFKKMIGSLNL